jgi:flagellar basal-body rod protein FlgB
MSSGIFSSPALQSLRLALDEASTRQQAISSNIANVNTPGYQRMDVSSSFERAFSSALTDLGNGQSIGQMPDPSIETAAVQGPARPDGNTVQIEQEMVGLAQNSAKYEFAAQMTSLNLHGLKYAITGQQ